jgi:alpha-tubulin suppressor-like RCC1 family protein
MKCCTIGDDATANRLAPVDVPSLTSGVNAIAAAYSHSCASTTGGGLKCWGLNDNGQIGDNSTTERHTPVDVRDSPAASRRLGRPLPHLRGRGRRQVLGWNAYGQLGDNSNFQRPVPTDVSGLTSGVTAVGAGGWHSCALTTGGGVKCWGYNVNGQLGDNKASGEQSLTPVDVTGLGSGVAAIAVGVQHACPHHRWRRQVRGLNTDGQVGNGLLTPVLVPTDVSGLTGVRPSPRATITCALTTGGGSSGGYNGYGQLGTGRRCQPRRWMSPDCRAGSRRSPQATSTLRAARGRQARCWGYNNSGQLGNDSTADSHTPVTAILPAPAIEAIRGRLDV